MSHESEVSRTSVIVVALGMLALSATPNEVVRAAESGGGCVLCGHVCPSDLETFCEASQCATTTNPSCEVAQCTGDDSTSFQVKISC